MKIKSFLAKPFASIINAQVRKNMTTALADQQSIFAQLIKDAANTVFGKEHNFQAIQSYQDFRTNVPLRDYEQFKPYINRIKEGEQNILWKGKPIYFAKTSGTTSGAKYIPISAESISNHIDSARNALLCYMAETGKTEFADGKMIFLSGSPVLERTGGIPTGRLSGIVNHFIPRYLRNNQLPSYETNCIEDWETKLGNIVAETRNENMTLISGIPPWMQMYFDWLLTETPGKKIKDIFPDLQVIVHGGVNFEPYSGKLKETLGGEVDFIETFPASEGFFAYQYARETDGLLLNTNSGLFFEFVPVQEMGNEHPTRLSLAEVQTDVNYALIVSTNAGLWAYSIGDTVRFTSLAPYKIVVTGRISHFISAFGEHVIGEEVDFAVQKAAKECNVNIIEFTVAPVVDVVGELPYHEWLIEFDQIPQDIDAFRMQLDKYMCQKNIYYNDLITGRILQPLKINMLRRNSFIEYMKSVGRLGGQNKVPRLSNNTKIADELRKYVLEPVA
jgi:GH3 auxin-responsive promoter